MSTDTEILKKAITKAVKNGFNNGYSSTYEPEEIIEVLTGNYAPDYKAIIFNHHFAKAFWGNELLEKEDILGHFKDPDGEYQKIEMGIPAWMFHLQKMVIVEYPIKYLETFVKDNGEEKSEEVGATS